MLRKISIETKDLVIGYNLKGGKRKIIHDALNLKLYEGELTCLLGLNGAGKSTLLRSLCGFQPIISGEVRIMGKLLEKYSAYDFSMLVGVVLTEKTNAGGISVYELVSLGRHPHTPFFGQLRQKDKNIIEQSLEAVGIAHKAKFSVAELSDGERQKAMIAKALAQQCPIIILDEPTAFLDITSRIETMALLRKLAKQQNKSILLSTHDLDLAIQMSDSIWLQNRGEAIVCGTPEDLILDGSLGRFFSKDGIEFDSSTGKFNAKSPDKSIGIEGDFISSYWLGNALIRNGIKPNAVEAGKSKIICKSATHIEFIKYNNSVKVSETIHTSIKDLIDTILEEQNNEDYN